MVRLRSDRWYSADGQQRSRARVAQRLSGPRRVVSLCILLGLVVVLMQKAADPRYIENGFRALGVPLSGQPQHRPGSNAADGLAGNARPGSSSPAHAGGTHPAGTQTTRPQTAGTQTAGTWSGQATAWMATCRDLVPRLLDELSDSEIAQLAESWFAAEPKTAADVTAHMTWAEHSLAKLSTLSDHTRRAPLTPAEQDHWLRQLVDFREQWQQLGDSPNRDRLPRAVSFELRAALTEYFDQRLLAMLSDATPWTASETLPFWRLLQRVQSRGEVSAQDDSSAGDSLPAGPAAAAKLGPAGPSVSTLQLAAQADVLRGSTVGFRGSVRRVERIERSYPPLGVFGGYWVVWLRGDDAAVQPVAVYTLDPRAGDLAKRLHRDASTFPDIALQGIVGKRLAYASSAGVDVAPTLFASSLVALDGPSQSSRAASAAELWNQFLVAVAGGCLLAAAIIVSIAWPRRAWFNRSQRPGRLRGSRSPGDGGTNLPAQTPGPLNRGFIQPAVLGCALVIPPLAVLLGSLLLSNILLQRGWSRDSFATPPSVQAVQYGAPPWATADQGDPVQGVFVTNMQSLFNEAAIAELRAYNADRSAEFPNALLKAAYEARRVGWPRATSLPAPVPLGDPLRLDVRMLSGWVRQATPVALSESQLSWFQASDAEQLYRVELLLQPELFGSSANAAPAATQASVPGNERSAQDSPSSPEVQPEVLLSVYCQAVPASWLSSSQLRQPARFLALLLERAGPSPEIWCGLAQRPIWQLPGTLTTAQLQAQLLPPLSPDYLALGQQGWDLSHIETIARQQQQPLGSQEADGFYSLLRIAAAEHAAGTITPRSLDSPLDTLSQAENSVGKEICWPVRIVTGTLVQVDQPAHRQQLGSSAYIQYDGFVDIGNDRIRFQPVPHATDRVSEMEFEGEFPVTIVTLASASKFSGTALAPGDASWSVGQYATLHGRFYRMWSYQSERARASGALGRQVAPLVIAADIVPTTPTISRQATEIGWLGWALCGATLVILAGILWLAGGNVKWRRRRPPASRP